MRVCKCSHRQVSHTNQVPQRWWWGWISRAVLSPAQQFCHLSPSSGTPCSRPWTAHPWRLQAHASKCAKWLGKGDVRDGHQSPQYIFWTTSDRAVFSRCLNTYKLLQPQCWGHLGAVGRAETRASVSAATGRGLHLHPEGELSSILEVRSSRVTEEVHWMAGIKLGVHREKKEGGGAKSNLSEKRGKEGRADGAIVEKHNICFIPGSAQG